MRLIKKGHFHGTSVSLDVDMEDIGTVQVINPNMILASLSPLNGSQIQTCQFPHDVLLRVVSDDRQAKF